MVKIQILTRWGLAPWVALLVSITLSTGVLVLPTPARATAPQHEGGSATVGASADAVGPPVWDNRKISKTKKADIKTVSAIKRHALSKDRKTLNYNKANRYDRGRTRTRRQFAAYWHWMGRKTSHISKPERAKVKRYLPKRSYASIRDDDPSKAVEPEGSPAFTTDKGCTGVTKFSKAKSLILPDTWRYIYKLNSCHTNAVRYTMNITAAVGAVLAIAFPPSAPLSGVLAGVLVIGSETIAFKQANSDVDAVRIEDDWHWISIWSQ